MKLPEKRQKTRDFGKRVIHKYGMQFRKPISESLEMLTGTSTFDHKLCLYLFFSVV